MLSKNDGIDKIINSYFKDVSIYEIMDNLGEFEKVDITDVWPHEEHDFTDWLSKKDNLDLLGSEIDMSLELIEKEHYIKSKRVDILCKDLDSETDGEYDLVIIENQYKKTDYKHLGQLITYASGTEAKSAIWVVEEAQDVHRTAVSWLNNQMEHINFYLVTIKLFKIDNSNPAPMFTVLEGPDQIIRKNRRNRTQSQTGILREEYWTGLRDYLVENASNYPRWELQQKPNSRSGYWLKFSGHSILNGFIGQREKYIAVAIQTQIVEGESNLYNSLYSIREMFEDIVGSPVEWESSTPNSEDWTRIRIKKENFTLENRDEWSDSYTWLAETMRNIIPIIEENEVPSSRPQRLRI